MVVLSLCGGFESLSDGFESLCWFWVLLCWFKVSDVIVNKGVVSFVICDK